MHANKPYRVVNKRTGKEYNYNRKGKGAKRLLNKPGTIAFERELQLANADERNQPLITVSDLCRKYEHSKLFLTLADSTKRTWRLWIKRIDGHFGSLRISLFENPKIISRIESWRDTWIEQPRTADYGIQVLRRMLTFAIRQGAISYHHCGQVVRLYKANRSDVIWEDSDVTELRKHASVEIMRAVDLALLTGLRRGDLLALKWSDIGEDSIRITTRKSAHQISVEIPLYDALNELLTSIPRTHDNVLVNSRNAAWRSGFDSSWQKALKKANIEKHFHDLRGTAVTRLSNSGFRAEEISLLMGWTEKSVERIIKHYLSRKEQFDALKKRLNSALRTK